MRVRASSYRALFVLSAVLLFLAMPAPSASSDEWQLLDGPYGGDIVGLATDASGSVYAARSDEIFRSDDGGASWISVSHSSINSKIYCLCTSPDGDIYAGVFTRGVYWSFDGGANWDHDQITHNPHSGLGATILAVGVNSDDVIFAGSFRSLNHGNSWLELGFYGYAFVFDADGNVYAGSSEGVRFSDDDGASWALLDTGMEGERINALAMNPSGHLLAGTRAAGVFLSTDEGATWTPMNNGLPTLGVEALAFDSLGRGYLALTDGGLYTSIDSGETWTPIDGGFPDPTFLSLVVGDGDELYAGHRYHGVYRSDDNGGAWYSQAAFAMDLPNLEDLSVSPVTDDIYLAARGGGIYRSDDGGASWEMRSDGLATTLTRAVSSDSAGRLYAGTDDGVYVSVDDGASWSPSNVGHEGVPANAILIDGDDNVLAVLGDNPMHFLFSLVRSTDGGATWSEVLSDSAGTFPTTAESWAIDSEDRIYLGGMDVATQSIIFVSEDDGATWDEVIIQGTGTLGLAIDSNDRVYAAMANNDLYESSDHGITWTEIPNGGWPNGTIGVLDVVAVDAYDAVLVSSRGSGIWRSADGGTSWSLFDDGLPTAEYPTVVFIEPVGDALFTATSNDGIFRVESGTSVEIVDGVPRLSFLGVSPNPAALSTRIQYALVEEAEVSIAIYDLSGRRVRTLEQGILRGGGRHDASWDGRNSDGRPVSSGIYFVSIEAGSHQVEGKVVLLR